MEEKASSFEGFLETFSTKAQDGNDTAFMDIIKEFRRIFNCASKNRDVKASHIFSRYFKRSLGQSEDRRDSIVLDEKFEHLR